MVEERSPGAIQIVEIGPNKRQPTLSNDCPPYMVSGAGLEGWFISWNTGRLCTLRLAYGMGARPDLRSSW